MPNKNALNVVLIVLAVIGALAILAFIGMWVMHGTMMGGMGGMMNCCGGMMMGGWLLGLLVLVGIVAAAVWLIRRHPLH